MKWTLPNILTVSRLVGAFAVPVVFFVLARPYADWAALALFIAGSLTDYVDGFLARTWNQVSRFGAMLDPIADKATIALSLIVIAALHGLNWLILLPAAAILFREVFVSGLREFLGSSAGLLKVTKLAKWKTTVQMVAISLLLAVGIAEHAVIERVVGMAPELAEAVLRGESEDAVGLRGAHMAFQWLLWSGVAALWLAMALTVMTGWDYLQKSLPYLKDPA